MDLGELVDGEGGQVLEDLVRHEAVEKLDAAIVADVAHWGTKPLQFERRQVDVKVVKEVALNRVEQQPTLFNLHDRIVLFPIILLKT